jgi:hypothetical protein
MGKVNLKELAEQMDFMMDEWSYFVNKRTGEIISVEDRHLGFAEDPDKIPESIAAWERDAIDQAVKLLENWDDLLCFPGKYNLNEYGMMEDFIRTVKDPHIRHCLDIAIEGRGAFRRFKDTAERFGAIDDWFDFKEKKLIADSKEWCDRYGLQYSKVNAE